MRNHGGVAIWPAWATGAVEVCPADPQWQWLDEGLTGELDVALTCWLVAPVEHVRSTAVPGRATKPILDLQAGFADLDCAPMTAETLGSGWHLVPRGLDLGASTARPWRRFLVQVFDDVQAAHLHLYVKSWSVLRIGTSGTQLASPSSCLVGGRLLSLLTGCSDSAP